MTTKPKIVLHIGAPKTGSTYIQRRLRAAPDLLRAHGIYMPVLPAVKKMDGNAKLLPVAIDQQAPLNFQRAFPDIDARQLNPRTVVAELLSEWHKKSETLLLSAEKFRPHHAAKVRELLPKEVDCRVVLFIRRQDDWADSYFNQLTKTQTFCEGIDAFVEQLCSRSDSRFCCPDWYAYYTAWCDAFGKCEIVLFEEARQDLLKGLFTAAGIEPLQDFPEIGPVKASLGINLLAYLLAQGEKTTFAEFVSRRAAGQKASQQLGSSKSQSLLSTTHRQKLRERFAESNQHLLNVIGYPEKASLLTIADSANSYCDLDRLYQTEDYEQFRTLADTYYENSSKKNIIKQGSKRHDAKH